jgi:hypothetical protein
MAQALLSPWKNCWTDRGFRVQVLFTLPVLIVVLTALARFLEIVEHRPGVVIPDPVLVLFSPLNLTWLTFGLIYISLFVAIGFLSLHPRLLLLAMQSYCVMVAFRVVAMYLLPLEPPPTMIPLNDPFVQGLGTGKLLTRDLFFSGHTSTLFLLTLTAKNRKVRTLFLLCTVLVAVSVIAQHVHYTVDVFAAPVFAYAAYRTVLFFRRDLGPGAA